MVNEPGPKARLFCFEALVNALKSKLAIVFGLMLCASAIAQSTAQPSQTTVRSTKARPSPGREIGNGAGNIGMGAAKGAGNLAKGTATGAADLVTLHPIDAAASLGKGAAVAGKDVTVGTAKGGGKIVAGVARGLKRLF
jgi:hypothetical protein